MVACYRLPLLFMVLAALAEVRRPCGLRMISAAGHEVPARLSDRIVALTTLFCPNAELASGL